MSNRQHQDTEAQVSAAMDASCERLDAATLSRLHHIRYQALHQPVASWLRVDTPRLTGLAAVLTLVLTLGIGLQWRESPQEPADVATAIEDIDILAADDQLALFEEYEFYQWVGMNESN